MAQSRRPQHCLHDGDSVAVARDGRAAVQLAAELQLFADASAERVILGAGEEAVDRQAIPRRLRDRFNV